MPPGVILLFVLQGVLLALFSFFAFFNYLYAIAALFPTRIRRTRPGSRRIAVVVVAFNEEYVVDATLESCDRLTWPDRLLILADDSTDPALVERSREIARKRGCVRRDPGEVILDSAFPAEIELWESDSFVLLHRPGNVGFKAGSIEAVRAYLRVKEIELMYLLDADWHPQPDALERTCSALEASDDLAFVQTKRLANPRGLNLFQKYVALHEEGCYEVDFHGRQVLGHPILFSGCCTLFRLDAVEEVGGFTPGHLTEDLDLTNRLWVNGWRGIYDPTVTNEGELPFCYEDFRKQQERWSAGSARSFRESLPSLLRTRHLTLFGRLSAIRQNAYFSTTLLTGISVGVGLLTVVWLALARGSFATESYLHFLERWRTEFLILVYGCLLANLVQPLVMILVRRRAPGDLLHLPMSFWLAWSVLSSYVIGNLRGALRLHLNWFRTPKPPRGQGLGYREMSRAAKVLNVAICLLFLGLYFTEGMVFGWFDVFAIVWIPAVVLGAVQ